MIEKDSAAILTAGSLTAVAPLFGDYALILIAAVFGAFVSASRINHASKGATVSYIFRSVSITAFSAGLAAQFISSQWFVDHTGIAVGHSWQLLAFVAFWMAVIGDGWFKLKDWAITRLERWANARTR